MIIIRTWHSRLYRIITVCRKKITWSTCSDWFESARDLLSWINEIWNSFHCFADLFNQFVTIFNWKSLRSFFFLAWFHEKKYFRNDIHFYYFNWNIVCKIYGGTRWRKDSSKIRTIPFFALLLIIHNCWCFIKFFWLVWLFDSHSFNYK